MQIKIWLSPSRGKVGGPENREEIQGIFGSSDKRLEILPKTSKFGLELRKGTRKNRTT